MADDESTNQGTRKRWASEISPECPYLDTIERSLLDFDLERACSVTLNTSNVYACLVCGKYFRGRGPQTPAYIHAVEESHYVYVHLDKGSFHCLPGDYVIQDSSLMDIQAALHPLFSKEQVQQIDHMEPSRDLFGRKYLPGFVGLSNLNKTDGINCVIQALAHVPPLRNYFLLDHSESSSNSNSNNKLAFQVTRSFAQVVRKLWSRNRFKSTVDPHDLIHVISVASKKRFGVGKQCEAGELMTWLLHQLHVGTGGTQKQNSSIIYKTFQGKLQVTTKEKKRQVVIPEQPIEEFESDTDDDAAQDNDSRLQKEAALPEYVLEESVTDASFLQLTLDLPDKPLFRDEDGGLVIPQEPLAAVLKKFDGISFSDAITKSGTSQRKQYRLLQLPNYLILCLARFKTNSYTRVKNPTIVAFPVKNLDLGEYVKTNKQHEAIPTKEQVEKMSVRVGNRRVYMFVARTIRLTLFAILPSPSIS
jgi:U4/U6.U5 tri-snRNP-associated protein 2